MRTYASFVSKHHSNISLPTDINLPPRPTPQVFVSAAPHTPPQQPSVALLRFLRLLSSTDWHQQPLLLRLNNELTPERQAAAMSRFRTDREKRPAMCLVTPYDERGDAWTRQRPTAAVLHHMQVRLFPGGTLSQISVSQEIPLSCFSNLKSEFSSQIRLRSTLRYD